MCKHLLSLIFLSAAFALGAAETVLFSTEIKAPEKCWNIRKTEPATRLATGNWPDGSSSTCMVLEIPKYNGTGERWPAAMLKLPVTDWSMADVLSFDIMTQTDVPLCVYIRDKAKRAVRHRLSLKPGRKTIRIEMQKHAKEINLAEVVQFHLYMQDPVQNHKVWFGPIKMTMLDLRENNRKFRAGSKKVWDFSLLSPQDKTAAGKAEKELAALFNKKSLLSGAELRRGYHLLDTLTAYQHKNDFMQRKTLKNGLRFGWTAPIEKVKQDLHLFRGEISEAPVLNVPRNASVSAQLVLLGNKATQLAWHISKPFKSSSGKVLAKENISLIPVGYVVCSKNRHGFDLPGKMIFPDPLLNWVDKINIAPDCYQSMYFEVNVPRGQASGIYNGEITVGGSMIPVQVKVRDFELPSGTSYPLIISANNVAEKVMTLFPDKDWKWVRDYSDKIYDLFAAHRMPLDSLYHGVLPTALEMKAAASRGVWKINVRSMAAEDLDSARIYMAKKALERAKTAGLKDRLYFYAFDESTREKYPAMRKISKGLKKIAPDVPIVTTAYDFTFGIESQCPDFDIWVPLIPRYEELTASVAAARKRGKQIWWYVCCDPGPPFPNVMIENPGAAHRLLMGVMAWKYKPDGFLYYECLNWKQDTAQKKGRWKKRFYTAPLTGAPVVDWSGASWRDINGDGRLVYPGADKPVPSLRMKLMRDGFEDHIALKMLHEIYTKHGKNQSAAWNKEAEKLLSIPQDIVSDLRNYTADHQKISKFRNRIDDCIEKAVR